MRCCEQIKVNLGYMRQKICMVGIASGLALGTLGYTHCCIEDVGILRSIPGMIIISPADSLETVELIMQFEDDFNIEIPDEDAEKILSVKAAVDYINSRI